MSSQLISVAAPGATAAPAVAGQKAVAPKTMADVFAALLALMQGGGDGTATQATTPTVSTDTGKAVLALLKPGDADAITPTEDDDKSTDDASPVAQLAQLLATLQQALAAGETPDPALLKKIEAAVEAISAALPSAPPPGADVMPAVAPAPTMPTDIMPAVSAVAPAHPAPDVMPAIVQVAGKPDVAPVAGGQPAPDPDTPILPSTLIDTLRAAGKLAGEVDPALGQKIEALVEKLDGFRAKLTDVVAAHPELKAIVAALTRPASREPGTPPTRPDVNAAPSTRPGAPADPTFAPAALEPRTVVAAKTVEHKSDAAAPDGTKSADDVKIKAAPTTQAEVKPAQPAADAKAALIQAAADGKTAAPVAAAPNATDAITATTGPTAVHTQPVLDAGTARVAQAAYQPPAQVNLPHLAFEVARHVQQGVSKFQVRLDPPELGRVDVSLDVDKSGQVNARLTVERSETLDLLQRDQRSLERALAQAGLDGSKTNLEFTLKQNPFSGRDGGQQQQPGGGSPFGVPSGVVTEADAAPLVIYQGTASPGGLNIFV